MSAATKRADEPTAIEPASQLPCRWCDGQVAEADPFPGWCAHCDVPHEAKGCSLCATMKTRNDPQNDYRP